MTVALNPRVALTFVPLVLLGLGMLWDWGRPGLYMDSINPEYLARWVLHGDDGTRIVLPGNELFGRLPVFTGTAYHGSTQLYFALPFFVALGINLAAWRVVQFAAAAVIVVLAVRLAGSGMQRSRLAIAAGVVTGVGLVADPGFTLTLRTQAYSCLFPVGLLLGSLLVLRVGQDGTPSQRRRLLAGAMYGLAAFSYFIFIMFGPAMLWILWRSIPGRRLPDRLMGYGSWFVGVVIGYLPFIVGVLLIARNLGGLSQAVHYLAHMSDTLDVTPRETGLWGRIRATELATAWTVDGNWVSLTYVRQYAGAVGTARGLIGAATIALGVGASVFAGADRARRQALQAVFALLASFWLGSLVFGDRLQGHHFAALIPIWYVAIGLSLAIIAERLWSLVPARTPRRRVSGVAVVAAVAATLIGLGVAGQAQLHSELKKSGGSYLYSQAITAWAVQLRDEAHGAAVITPDWGYAMPAQFLAGDRATVLWTGASPALVKRMACTNGAVAIVNSYPATLDLAAMAKTTGTVVRSVEFWGQSPDQPLFQVAWFDRSQPC